MTLPSFCAGILWLLVAIPDRAESPFYIRTALGPAIADDIKLSGDLNARRVSVAYAASFGLAGGWQINRWLGAELETGLHAF